jgi:uncharacterized protein (DUF427 family)
VSLTTGKGPLSASPAGRFSAPIPPGVIYIEPFQRRVRGFVGGECVLDSERVLLVHRPGQSPTYAFPPDDVRVDSTPEPDAEGHVRVAWDAVEEWFEEEERAIGHPRNPYHRIDCIRTSRRLHIEIAGTVLVDTTDTMGLYETSLAPKLYVAPERVRTDLLVPSTTTTYCPYKGTASHWNAVIDGEVVPDVAWSYEDPLPESLPIKGMLSFY